MSTTNQQTDSESWYSFDNQDMMVFILIMSLHGLQMMFAELLPSFSLGGLELEIGPFLFISYTLVFLFRSFWGCLAVPVGGIVFGEILIGDFSAFGAVESLLMITVSLYLATTMIADPEDVKWLAVLAVVAKGMEELAAQFIDVGKFYVGVESLEAIEWLPETIWAVEVAGATTQVIIAGIIFGALPMMYFYPRMRGKIEPLLGMEPVEGHPSGNRFNRDTLKALVAWVVLTPIAFVFEAFSETSGAFLVYEPKFVEAYGQLFFAVPIVAAAVVAYAVVFYRQRTSSA
jgi:hypothetical protein